MSGKYITKAIIHARVTSPFSVNLALYISMDEVNAFVRVKIWPYVRDRTSTS